MNFRQRMAWVAVFLYLAATCLLVYYIFEISDGYNVLALDHVGKHHNDDPAKNSQDEWFFTRALSHIVDVPLPMWLFIAFLPYIQVFAMLLACTKPQPQFSMALLWPLYLFLKCHGTVYPHDENYKKAIRTFVPKDHPLIDT